MRETADYPFAALHCTPPTPRDRYVAAGYIDVAEEDLPTPDGEVEGRMDAEAVATALQEKRREVLEGAREDTGLDPGDGAVPPGESARVGWFFESREVLKEAYECLLSSVPARARVGRRSPTAAGGRYGEFGDFLVRPKTTPAGTVALVVRGVSSVGEPTLWTFVVARAGDEGAGWALAGSERQSERFDTLSELVTWCASPPPPTPAPMPPNAPPPPCRYSTACSPLLGVQLRTHPKRRLPSWWYEEGDTDEVGGASPEANVLSSALTWAMVHGPDPGGTGRAWAAAALDAALSKKLGLRLSKVQSEALEAEVARRGLLPSEEAEAEAEYMPFAASLASVLRPIVAADEAHGFAARQWSLVDAGACHGELWVNLATGRCRPAQHVPSVVLERCELPRLWTELTAVQREVQRRKLAAAARKGEAAVHLAAEKPKRAIEEAQAKLAELIKAKLEALQELEAHKKLLDSEARRGCASKLAAAVKETGDLKVAALELEEQRSTELNALRLQRDKLAAKLVEEDIAVKRLDKAHTEKTYAKWEQLAKLAEMDEEKVALEAQCTELDEFTAQRNASLSMRIEQGDRAVADMLLKELREGRSEHARLRAEASALATRFEACKEGSDGLLKQLRRHSTTEAKVRSAMTSARNELRRLGRLLAAERRKIEEEEEEEEESIARFKQALGSPAGVSHYGPLPGVGTA